MSTVSSTIAPSPAVIPRGTLSLLPLCPSPCECRGPQHSFFPAPQQASVLGSFCTCLKRFPYQGEWPLSHVLFSQLPSANFPTSYILLSGALGQSFYLLTSKSFPGLSLRCLDNRHIKSGKGVFCFKSGVWCISNWELSELICPWRPGLEGAPGVSLSGPSPLCLPAPHSNYCEMWIVV